MKSLLIFGGGDAAELAHYYFENDSDYTPIAFVVDAAYLKEPSFCGLPVVAFEEVAEHLMAKCVTPSYSPNALRNDKGTTDPSPPRALVGMQRSLTAGM